MSVCVCSDMSGGGLRIVEVCVCVCMWVYVFVLEPLLLARSIVAGPVFFGSCYDTTTISICLLNWCCHIVQFVCNTHHVIIVKNLHVLDIIVPRFDPHHLNLNCMSRTHTVVYPSQDPFRNLFSKRCACSCTHCSDRECACSWKGWHAQD